MNLTGGYRDLVCERKRVGPGGRRGGYAPARQTTFSEAERLVREREAVAASSSAQKRGFRFLSRRESVRAKRLFPEIFGRERSSCAPETRRSVRIRVASGADLRSPWTGLVASAPRTCTYVRTPCRLRSRSFGRVFGCDNRVANARPSFFFFFVDRPVSLARGNLIPSSSP